MVGDQADGGGRGRARKGRAQGLSDVRREWARPIRKKRKSASLRLRQQARAVRAARAIRKRPWSVVYRHWWSKRPITRRFATERAARAYYKSLWRRREPPVSQAVVGPPAM